MTILGYSDLEFISGSMLMFLALVSFLCTVATLWLIHDMKRRNGYLLLINNVTVSQLIYDLAFVFLPFYNNQYCLNMLTFMCTFAGMAVTLWTNVISLVLYNIVRNLRSFDIYAHYPLFAATIFAPSLALAILVVHYYGKEPYFEAFNQVYYWVRIGSILFNILIHGLISYKLDRMGYRERGAARTDDPVRELASRIKYYPIVQIVSRAGAAWYELAYGFDTDSYSKRDMGATQAVSLFFFAICVPTAGIGYFLVFLKVQPAAYHHLCARCSDLREWAVRTVCGCCFVEADDWRRRSREDSVSSSIVLGKMSQPLMSMGNSAVDYSELDEDELSYQIDQRYNTRSQDSASVASANTTGALSAVSRGSAAAADGRPQVSDTTL